MPPASHRPTEPANVMAGQGDPVWRRLVGRLQGPLLAFVLLVTVVVGGTLGYVLIERWHPWDALYMTIITITTVGYREVHTLSPAGEAFTMVLLVSGVGTALYAFTLIATIVVEGGLHHRLSARRRARMLEALSQHFIVCGYGRIGSIIVDEFRRQNIPHVVVERDAERVMQIIEAGGLAVEADASREEVLEKVRIDRARGLIAAVGTDAENVYTVLTARLMRPDLFIIGRAETDDARRKLTRAGADRVLAPYQIGALQMALTAIRPAVVDFVQLATSSENLDLTMEQVKIEEGASLAGRSIIEANLRQRYGVVVVGIQRKDGRMDFNPPPETVMTPGDFLVVLGTAEKLKDLERDAVVSA